MTRSLLLKGLAGVAALGGAVGGGFVAVNSGLLGGGKVKEQESKDLSKFNHKELIEKVGLSCGLDGNELTDNTPKDCSVKEGGSINVRLGDQTEEEGVTFTNGSSKLKVSKSEGYSRELKFVVDSGDISLSKKDGSTTPSTIQKLEQFETYEVEKVGSRFYLRRKTDAKEEKIKALGLPTGEGKCSLPESGDSDCTLTIEEAKKAKFEKQSGEEITLSSGTVTLKISKVEDSSFPDGYRFTFTFPSDQTINTKKVKANTSYDFKIKKGETGNTLTLERAWSEDKDFAKKAGLDCANSETNGCTVPAGSQKLNVKVGDKKKEGIESKSGNGKIKMEKEQAGYNQGLKFTITTADVTLTGGTSPAGSEDISKLEELETYEITEEGGKYYLTRKTSKDDGIKSSLVLPKGCDLPTSSTEDKTCSVDSEGFKNINFDGKGDSTTGSGTLTISKATNTTDFPLGYRFTFKTTTEATITTSTNTIKANIPTDFKIKKEEGKPLSLEKAWSNFSLAEKVGLSCTGSQGSEECCTKTGTEKLNVKKGNDVKTDIDSVGTETGKIKVEKDQAGYNQGLKFTITTGDVTLTGGNSTGGSNIDKLEELETYEITEEGGKYYLTRKTEASKTIGDLLGLTDAGCNISATPCTLSTEQIKKVKFDGKETDGPTASANATLKITSGTDKTDFPLGYRFSLQSTKDITIKNAQGNTNIVKQNISTDFKIKKETNNPTSLTLEKAWTADSLGKKVGFQSCNDSSKECTIDNSKKLNIKQDDKKDTGLSKGSGSGSGSAKIKVEKDQEGYNQGFKFTISDGSISLTGGSASGDNKITSLDEYETYEIKEESGEWYLVRKTKADDFILKELGLTGISGCSSLKLPRNGSTETCSIPDVNVLKKIKFENATGHSWPVTVSGVQLEINKETSFPAGFKFTFNSCESTCSLPGSTSASKDSSDGLIYQIKKDSKSGSISLEPKKSNSSKR